MHGNLPPKKRLYEQLARVAKALAQPGRLELLEALGQGERSVEGLAAATGMSVANTSHHLQVLRDGGLVSSRREGLQVIYRLSDPAIPKLLSCLRQVAERQLAEVERIVREYFDSRDGLTPVKREELLRLVKRGDVVVIDVRPPEEFAAGHIPGAVNIPVNELPKRLKSLPKDQEIVAYCRGPYCMFAVDAVAILRRKGYRARRLEEGFPEWKAERLPVEKGA
ncbi:MAG: metalloregulator ArsR/SmtB family transcription factor [Burkholderiales bacterium]|jgi:rhodanese-related sulfurtransferase/biotin operon repressor|nr:metalloregulator ArsR/SmtB family transcription factor [Burkholderiales bacterium]